MNTITLKENGNKITKMNRHPILSALPMLPKARLKVSTNQLDSLLTTLRPIAQRMQSRQPRAFYSVRQISTHFGVHVSTVSRVYDVLKSEGILTTVRGSRSMLQGTVADRQLSVRGIVGVPLSIKSFVRFQDYRVFALRLQHELRCNGFAAVLAFHEDDEAHQPAFAERLLRYRADTVIWFQPPIKAKETAARITDRGIRVISVTDNAFVLGQYHYNINREPALLEAFSQWQNEGITLAMLAREYLGESVYQVSKIEALLQEANLAYRFCEMNGETAAKFLHDLPHSKNTAVVFPSSAFAALLGFRAPNDFAKLLDRVRILLTQGPVNLAFAQVPAAPADIIGVDWQLVAERIVADLVNKVRFIPREVVTFEAQWLRRVPLSTYARSI